MPSRVRRLSHPVADPFSVEGAPNRARRAVGYVRVSGRGQLAGDGPERQAEAIRGYAKSHRLELVEFSEELAEHSFNVAALQHVVPAWINRVGGADHPTVQIFNEKIGPLVGVKIEADGSVVVVAK